jgi:DNA-binding HxlR family transcriptional regulator
VAKQNVAKRGFETKVAARTREEAPKQPKHAAPSSELELDRLIHEKLRLGILSALAVNSTLTFNDLKKLLSTSDGNLSVHARKLEEAEYIACEKTFEGRMPKTEYKLTTAGRKALERYLDEMESLIKSTRALTSKK